MKRKREGERQREGEREGGGGLGDGGRKTTETVWKRK